MQGARPAGRFPKAQRIRRRREFREVQSRGRRVRTAHFILLLYARSPREPDDGAARLGIIASRKIGNAVRRNRAKRLVREAFRATRDLMQPEIDLVVIVRRDLQGMKLDDVVAEWRQVSTVIDRRVREAKADRARRAEDC